jgi:hypothetical protein
MRNDLLPTHHQQSLANQGGVGHGMQLISQSGNFLLCQIVAFLRPLLHAMPCLSQPLTTVISLRLLLSNLIFDLFSFVFLYCLESLEYLDYFE